MFFFLLLEECRGCGGSMIVHQAVNLQFWVRIQPLSSLQGDVSFLLGKASGVDMISAGWSEAKQI